MKLLVCGGAGFIGSNFVKHMLESDECEFLVNVDKLTYAGSWLNVDGFTYQYKGRYAQFVQDIQDTPGIIELLVNYEPTCIVNFAAESHVDRSILNPTPFIKTNIEGVYSLLSAIRYYLLKTGKQVRLVQISTDEVYGSLDITGHPFTECSSYNPSNPYAATKASADLLCLSHVKTYGLDVCIVRPCNNFGPHQFPEKFIPLSIMLVQNSKPIKIYGDGKQIRQWLHVSETCNAVRLVISMGRSGDIYNLSGVELENLELAKLILQKMGKKIDMIEHIADRAAHDFRYSMSADFIETQIGWRRVIEFSDSIEKTIEWYCGDESSRWRYAVKMNESHSDFMKEVYK